ncbi:MAG: hypothetical protein ACJAV5_000142 [Vicingaceae bacterium]|jgi:hypothetical protein
MNKNKFYVIVIVGLLISNGMLVFFMTQKEHREKPHHSPKEIVIDRLDLDEAQIKNYLELVSVHREATNELMKGIRAKRSLLYELLTASGSTTKVDSTVINIGQLQQELERLNFNHFQDIQLLCNANQLQAFEDLSREFAELFGGGKGKPKRGPRR